MFLSLNTDYKKHFLILALINSNNCFNLLFFNELISTMFDVIMKSMTYIQDILSIILIGILFYASIGMIIYGGFITEQTMNEYINVYGDDVYG